MSRAPHALAALLAVAALVPAGLRAAREDAQALGAYDGRPEFKEGSDRSYFVWRDGNRWHVRWTTMGTPREFTGSVRAVGGRLDDLKRIDVEAELKVIRRGRPARVVRGPRGRAVGVAPGRAPVVASREQDHITKVEDRLIRWNARTNDDIDGFDFTADAVEVLHFDLKIAGDSRPISVEIGRNNVHPRDNPFNVRIR